MEKNKKLNRAVEDIHEIKMTAEEKELMLKNIMSTKVSGSGAVKSPYASFSFFLKLPQNRFAYYGFLSLLIFALGGGAVFASGNSLPGSVLYPLKVRLVEPVKGALLFSPEAKINYQNELAVSRLVEAETLLSSNKLDEKKERLLSSLLEEHTETLNKAIDEYQESESADEDTNNEFVTDFKATMGAHAQILDILKKDRAEGRDDKGEQKNRPSVSNTARDSVKKIEHAIKNEGEKAEKYKKRKEGVQSIIDSTRVETRKEDTKTPEEKKIIIDNTEKKLEEAKQYLLEGEEEEKRGDSKKAYERILESESSAKEARLLQNYRLFTK